MFKRLNLNSLELFLKHFSDLTSPDNVKQKLSILIPVDVFSNFRFTCASCACVLFTLFFFIWTFGGFVPHVWVDASFRHHVEMRLPCLPLCSCVCLFTMKTIIITVI